MVKPSRIIGYVADIKASQDKANEILLKTPYDEAGMLNAATVRDVMVYVEAIRRATEKITMEFSEDTGKLLHEDGMSDSDLKEIDEAIAAADLPDPLLFRLLNEVYRLRAWAAYDIGTGFRSQIPVKESE